MKKTRALVVVSFAAVAVGAAIASCTSFSSGDNGGIGGAGGDTTGGTGGMNAGSGGTPDQGAGGSNNPGTGGANNPGTGGNGSPGGTGGAAGSGTGTGGKTGTGGMTTTGMGGATGTGGVVANTNLPCDIFNAAGNTCVAAHSTVRQLNSKYTGPLYQVCKGGGAQTGPNSCTGGTTMDIPQVNGYANASVQDTFCTGAVCTIYTIYDQSGMGNLLRPSPKGGNSAGANAPAIATALPLKAGGHNVYGVYIRRLQGYRAGCTGCAIPPVQGGGAKGVATGDLPETEYMVTSQNKLIDGCCFDYGNAEITNNDDRAGTMEAVYFGGGVVWDTGAEGLPHTDTTNPWVMADLEDGLYAGWSTTQTAGASQQIASNTALHFNYVTALIIGDVASMNGGKGRFAIMGGDATSASPLKVMYDGQRPTHNVGYVNQKKQGSIILGTGGDNSNQAEGYFFEGVMTQGAASTATITAVQASIAAAKYGQ